MIEEWRTVVYNGEVFENYEVSNTGKVRSLYGKPKILKPKKARNGYLHIGLVKDGKQKQVTVHRVVGFTWIPNDDIENKTDIDHIDRNRQNNHVSNLRWSTRKKNVEYSRGKRVLCIETGQVFDSVTQASEWLGVTKTAISKACLGKSKTCRKLHWKFVE